MSEPVHWEVGEHVQVSLPFDTDGKTVHAAKIIRIQDPGPKWPERTVKVAFDDHLIYGGLGVAWVSPTALSHDGDTPGRPDRG